MPLGEFGEPLPQLEALTDAEMQTAEGKLEQIANDLRNRHIPAKVRVLKGSPARELLRCADESTADLVVVGKSQRGALDRMVVGSVARAVVTAAATSVSVDHDNGTARWRNHCRDACLRSG